ncbi:MAG: copper homeostasis protein CutC [Omnitrophica WOR_2 bacterium]
MNTKINIEICVDNVESALIAQKGGADRIELCSALCAGGLTPSKGLMEFAISHLEIPVNVLIRPRSGDFLYSRSEYDVIKSDIFSAKVAGAAGIVIGMLNSDATVDTCRMKEVIEMCNPLPVTFHRAFDMVKDQYQALEDIINLGCERILTSGGHKTATSGSLVISELMKQASGRIIIMPGSGINEKNIVELIEATRCKEYHLSATTEFSGKMKVENINLNDVFPNSFPLTDFTKVELICSIAASFSV